MTVRLSAGKAPDFATETRNLHDFPAAGAVTVALVTRQPPDRAFQVTLPFELVVATLTSDAVVFLRIAFATCRRPPTSTSVDVATSDVSAIVVAVTVNEAVAALTRFDTVHSSAVVVQTTAPEAS